MVGRLDDWLKVVSDKQGKVPTPGSLDWAGVATFKNALKTFGLSLVTAHDCSRPPTGITCTGRS